MKKRSPAVAPSDRTQCRAETRRAPLVAAREAVKDRLVRLERLGLDRRAVQQAAPAERPGRVVLLVAQPVVVAAERTRAGYPA